jgi:hypothetical protein
LISGFLFLTVAWGLYVLLRPVNKDVALLFLLLNTVGVAIQGASMLGNPPNKRFNLTRRRFAQSPPRLKRVFRKRD